MKFFAISFWSKARNNKYYNKKINIISSHYKRYFKLIIINLEFTIAVENNYFFNIRDLSKLDLVDKSLVEYKASLPNSLKVLVLEVVLPNNNQSEDK